VYKSAQNLVREGLSYVERRADRLRILVLVADFDDARVGVETHLEVCKLVEG
jgi:hypothetical protein